MKVGHIAPRAQRPVKPGPPVSHASRGQEATHYGFGGDEAMRRKEITKRVQAVTAWYAAGEKGKKPVFHAGKAMP